MRALTNAPGNFSLTLAEDAARPDSHWQDMLAEPAVALFALFDDDAMIGMTGAFTDRDDPRGTTAAFGMTWIAPGDRGRGLSRLYYRERVAWACATGHQRIVVGYRASNLASGAAMRAAGFVSVRRRSHRWPDGGVEDELLYGLDLHA